MSLNRLQQAFVDALGVAADSDFETLHATAVPEWDSIGRMNLVLELERAFGVTLSTEDVFDLDSFARASEILRRHGVDLSV